MTNPAGSFTKEGAKLMTELFTKEDQVEVARCMREIQKVVEQYEPTVSMFAVAMVNAAFADALASNEVAES